jgi:hypothetical protein
MSEGLENKLCREALVNATELLRNPNLDYDLEFVDEVKQAGQDGCVQWYYYPTPDMRQMSYPEFQTVRELGLFLYGFSWSVAKVFEDLLKKHRPKKLYRLECPKAMGAFFIPPLRLVYNYSLANATFIFRFDMIGSLE